MIVSIYTFDPKNLLSASGCEVIWLVVGYEYEHLKRNRILQMGKLWSVAFSLGISFSLFNFMIVLPCSIEKKNVFVMLN